MSEPFIAEIRIFSLSGGQVPRGWALCNGQLMSIAQNTALFSLLGTTYGGDGRVTFALPDLRGRSAVGQGVLNARGVAPNFAFGQIGGELTHTLTTQETPPHTHLAQGTTATTGAQSLPTNGLWQNNPDKKLYGATPADVTMAPGALANTGGNAPHANQQPYLALSFMIALQGIFPSRP
jgi:microcystin-dependent protein